MNLRYWTAAWNRWTIPLETMKKKLYLMRHGETLFNLQSRIQGWCDSPLTEKGETAMPKGCGIFQTTQHSF